MFDYMFVGGNCDEWQFIVLANSGPFCNLLKNRNSVFPRIEAPGL